MSAPKPKQPPVAANAQAAGSAPVPAAPQQAMGQMTIGRMAAIMAKGKSKKK